MPSTQVRQHRARLTAAATALVFAAACGAPMKQVSMPAAIPAPPDPMVEERLPPGTEVPVRLQYSISSLDDKSGAPQGKSDFAVAQDVVGPTGVVFISAGTPIIAEVERRPHRRMGRPGSITIRFQSTTGVDGAKIWLANDPIQLRGKKRLGGVIAGSILLFPFGLLFLLLKGGDVTLEGGSGLTATVVE